jgi:hypothetical protein
MDRVEKLLRRPSGSYSFLMTPPCGMERRDPISPVLRLGTVLANARRDGRTGLIEVQDRGHVHEISIRAGSIVDVTVDGSLVEQPRPHDPFPAYTKAASLFALPRPHIIWTPGSMETRARVLDPMRVVLGGVTGRRDLFDPVVLLERIPVQTLSIPKHKTHLIEELPLTRREREFLYRLQVPTPIPMALWKRGLDPRYAGALIVALNLLGVWGSEWEPGLLPRLTAAVKILRRLQSSANDFDLLGITDDSNPRATDKAFRRLSLDLHPDRVSRLPKSEAKMAQTAFKGAASAYERIRSSRRSRPVRAPSADLVARVNLVKCRPSGWRELYTETLRARGAGNTVRARAFAIKTLAMSPPKDVRTEIMQIIACVA